MTIKMIHANFFNVDMESVMDDNNIDKFDMILTDPPYGSNIFNWDGKTLTWQKKWIRECMLLLKDTGSMYLFYAPANMSELNAWIKEYYKLYNIIPWIHKNSYAAGRKYGQKWTEVWDAIIYVAKDTPDFNVRNNLYERVGDTFNYIIANDPKHKMHPAQKPVKVVQKPLLASSNKGDWILDPFMGTGTTLKVAQRHERNAIGIEADEDTFEDAKKRIRTEHQHRLTGVYEW